MVNRKLRTISFIVTGAMLLSACTSNEGVATNPSETAAAADPAAQTDPTVDLSGESVETVYGSQLPNYLNHQYYFEGEPVLMTESNFYFIDTFTELTQYAGYYYPATPDGYIDLSASIDAQATSEDMTEYSTYGDFFISYSEQMLESACIINKLAADEGLTLPQETLDQIDSIIANLQTSGADPAGITLDEYLSIYYGEGTTEESFRQTVINYYMADLYTQEFIDNYEFDDSEIMVPNIRYTLFQVTPDSTEEEIAAAEAAANEMYESSGGDIDAFTVAAALAYTNGDTADYGDIAVPDDGSIDATFTEWAWDSSRQENDIAVIHSDDFGYFVVAYLGLTEIDQSSKDQIAVQRMSEIISEAINNDEYEFYCADEFAPAPTVAVDMDQLQQDVLNGLETQPTETAASVGSLTGNKGLDILLISLSVVGAVAVLGLAALGVSRLVKGKDSGNKEKTDSDKEE